MLNGPHVSKLVRPSRSKARLAVKLGSRWLAHDVPNSNTQISSSIFFNGNAQSKLTFEAPKSWIPKEVDDPLNNYGQKVLVTAVVEVQGVEWEIPQGWYWIYEWKPDSRGNVVVTAYDLWSKIGENTRRWPSSPAAGATLLGELQEQVGNHISVRLKGVPSARVPRTFQYGTDPIQNVQDLCAAFDAHPKISTDGYLDIIRASSLRGLKPVVMYAVSDLLRDAERGSLPRRPNIFLVTGSGTVPNGTRTKTLVSQKFTNQKRDGWGIRGVEAKWSFYAGYSGESARCTWTATSGGSLVTPQIRLDRSVVKDNPKRIRLRVRSKSSNDLTVAVMRGSKVVSFSTVSDPTTWQLMQLDVPKGYSMTGIRIYQTGTVSSTGSLGSEHWIALDNVEITEILKDRTTDISRRTFEDEKSAGVSNSKTATGVSASWSFPSGHTGKAARCTWTAKKGSLTTPELTLTGSSAAKDETKKIEFWIRSKSSAAITVSTLTKAGNVGETVTVTSPTTWKKVTINLTKAQTLSKVRIRQTGTVSGSGSLGSSHWIEVDDIAITRFRERTENELVNLQFTERELGGLKAGDMQPQFQFRSKGVAGDFLKFKWDCLSGTSGNARLEWSRNGNEVPSKDDTYRGVKTITVAVSASTSDDITVSARTLSGTVAASKTVSGGASWRQVTLTVPDRQTLGSVRVSQAGAFNRNHWVGVDNFLVKHEYPVTKKARWAIERRATHKPYDIPTYGRVVLREEISAETTRQAVINRAQELLDEAMVATVERDVALVPDFRLELGDICRFYVAPDDAFKGRVTSFTKRFDGSGHLMAVGVEALKW